MFGWIKESAVYEAGLIGSGSWDEESSSYKVDLPAEVLQEAARVIDKGYLFFVHGTIEAADGATEFYLQANKLETQTTPDGDVMYISFADGSTLTKGLLTIPYGEGGGTPAIQNIWDSTGEGAVAGGVSTSEASGAYAFAFGNGVKATSANSHAEGTMTKAFGTASHAEGYKTEAGTSTNSKNYAHAEGTGTKATGEASHAEGGGTTASGGNAHAEGGGTTASGDNSHAEGAGTTASGPLSHAEGAGTTASGANSHAEGSASFAIGNYSHAEGNSTSHGAYCHSEGYQTRAGSAVVTSNETCHAEGYQTEATGKGAHSEGIGTKALGEAQHAGGMYNIPDYTSLETIGNGTASHNSNARTLNKQGDEWLAGQIQPENGLRLKAPNGTYYNVTVDNNGALSIVAAT